jgi:prevent-host-death family protein
MKKIAIGSRELKTRLGTYLREVQRGKTLIVTERGRAVAELRPIAVEVDGENTCLDELVALGLLSRKSRAPLARLKPVAADKPLSAAVIESRKDRV